MNIFICWSGDRSKKVAEALARWLPKVEPRLAPFISHRIQKGTLWFTAVGRALQTADAGLICLTPENLDSPWVHFELGALAKELTAKDRRIYTYLYGVVHEDLRGPLAEYQATTSSREDTKSLLRAMTKVLRRNRKNSKRDRWNQAFERLWPELETALHGIPQLGVNKVLLEFDRLFQRKTFSEPLDECVNQNWHDRYSGARQTLERLRDHTEKVRRHCAPHVIFRYGRLTDEVNGYMMDIKAFLLNGKAKFRFHKNGKLNIPDRICNPCERRRKRIKELAVQLVDSRDSPVNKEAIRYEELATFAEKKRLIHQTARELQTKPATRITDHLLTLGIASNWEFDRIWYYLVNEQQHYVKPRELADCIEKEVERLESTEDQGSLVPLHYAVDALRASMDQFETTAQEHVRVTRALDRAKQYIASDSRRNPQLKRNLREAEAKLSKR